jgi:hypothetical protein
MIDKHLLYYFQIEEALSNSIQEKKIRYIFEGVSHLVAAVLISAAEHIRLVEKSEVVFLLIWHFNSILKWLLMSILK